MSTPTQTEEAERDGDAEFTALYFKVMIPFMLIIGLIGTFFIWQGEKSDKRAAQYRAEAQEWRDDCRAAGGHVKQHAYQVWVTPRTKKEKREFRAGYQTRYSTYCVKPLSVP